jgi:hypothetical protein
MEAREKIRHHEQFGAFGATRVGEVEIMGLEVIQGEDELNRR